MPVELKLYIDGQWVLSSSSEMIEVVDPTHRKVAALTPRGAAEDVERAVDAARRAFEGWATTPVGDRCRLVDALGEAIVSQEATIVRLGATDIGTPVTTGRYMHVKLPATTCSDMAIRGESYQFESSEGKLAILREPVGVVACITPWNYPLHQITAKIAAALVAGCTVVVKPSEVAPLSAMKLAELVDEVGFPAGVVNFVSGLGPVVGEQLAQNAGVDMVSFTGSIRAGTRVAALASATVKKVTLELGGKSANLVLDDVTDLDPIVSGAISNAYLNSGQTCSALTRLIVPRSRASEVEELAVDAAKAQRLGDPLLDETQLGPIVSEVQYERVRAYIQSGVDEGAKLLTGGLARPDGVPDGYFVAPTVFARVESKMKIAQEEIFGPVLSILSYDSEDEGIAIANDSRYGLSGGVWAGDAEHATAVARRLRTGQVKINGGAFNPTAPFGGYKHSGVGRELGSYGFEEYLEVKALTY